MTISTPVSFITPLTSTTNTTSYTSASGSFVAGRIYEVACEYSTGAVAPTPPSLSGASMTWTSITSNQYKASGGNQCGIAAWWGRCTSSTSSTLVFNFGAVTAGGIEAVFVEEAGLDFRSGYGIGRTTTNTDAALANGSPLTSSLLTPFSANSRARIFLGSNTLGSFTAEAGWTRLVETPGHSTPSEYGAFFYNNTAWDSSLSVTNATGGAAQCALIGWEIRDTPVTAGFAGMF